MMKPTTQKLPPCSIGNYACTTCPHPQTQITPKGPSRPCDGTTYFCRYATPTYYPYTAACQHATVSNFHCTHGGGTCEHFAGMREQTRKSPIR